MAKTFTINGQQVKIWTILQEEWAAGAHLNCNCCDAPIRNIVEIEGRPYGRNCGARALGLPVPQNTKKQIDVMTLIIALETRQAWEDDRRQRRAMLAQLNWESRPNPKGPSPRFWTIEHEAVLDALNKSDYMRRPRNFDGIAPVHQLYAWGLAEVVFEPGANFNSGKPIYRINQAGRDFLATVKRAAAQAIAGC